MALHVCILTYLKSVPVFLDHPVEVTVNDSDLTYCSLLLSLDCCCCVQETADYVLSQFSLAHTNIEKGLSSYSPDTHGAPGKYFDGLVVELQKAQKQLTDSARLLSSYQLEKAQVTINQLKAAIEDERRKVEPKKKFAFKSEKKKTVSQVFSLVISYYVQHLTQLSNACWINYVIFACDF